MMPTNNKIKGLLAALLGTSIIGLSYIFVKIGLRYSSPIDLLADRLLLAFAAIYILQRTRMVKIRAVNYHQKISLFGLSLLYPAGFFAFQILGIRIVPASEAAIIYALLPVVTLMASSIILKERTIFVQKLGSVLSVLGVIYITVQSVHSVSMNYWGYIFILISLVTIVAYFIVLKHIISDIPPITVTFYILLYSTLLINVINVGIYGLEHNFRDYFVRFHFPQYIYILIYLGILSTLVTSFLTNYSLKVLPASIVGVFNNLSPVIGLFAGVLLLSETLHIYYIYGGILVLAGLALSSLTKSEDKNKKK
ncbi:DMT family transporter [Porphyromonas pogonae]|uniref:DMT family transporter n=1 Tax=Porphyromonas pogonae TaxID=867595 RepID=UPI002E7A6277|nr:DMT family transporter [Porphyromonas pogonae]